MLRPGVGAGEACVSLTAAGASLADGACVGAADLAGWAAHATQAVPAASRETESTAAIRCRGEETGRLSISMRSFSGCRCGQWQPSGTGEEGDNWALSMASAYARLWPGWRAITPASHASSWS